MQAPVINVYAQEDMTEEKGITSETEVSEVPLEENVVPEQEDELLEEDMELQEEVVEKNVVEEVVAQETDEGEEVTAVEVPDEELPEIFVGEKNTTNFNAEQENPIYKFIPEESGKYAVSSSELFDIHWYDESMFEFKYTYNYERVKLEGGKTYYIELAQIGTSKVELFEWSMQKVDEIEIKEGETYITESEVLIDYKFIPQKTAPYFMNLNNGGCRVYDNSGISIRTYYLSGGKRRVSLLEGEMYVIQVTGDTSWNIEVAEISGDYAYMVQEDGTVEIVEYLGEESIVSIPKTIEGKTVSGIGEAAFYENKIIEKVTIPNSIVRISQDAFNWCRKLVQVEFETESQLKEIADYAFANSGIGEITIPDSVVGLGEAVFFRCESLQKITLGSGLKKVNALAFWYCSKLNQIDFEKAQNVTKIEYQAFGGCGSLQDIQLPNSVKSLGGNAMLNTAWYNNQKDGILYLNQILYKYKGTMEENTTIEMQNNTIAIAGRAFENQENLVGIEIPDTVANIGKLAFYNCTSMQSVTIPETVTEIEKMSFGYIKGDEKNGTLMREEGFYGYVKPMEGFTIYGESDSAAQKYAEENGFAFISTGAAKEFTDVKESDWYYDAVNYVYENDLMNGMTEETFEPETVLDRAQFATILFRASNEEKVEYEAKFPDVPENQWYTDGVMWASNTGVVSGYNNGMFGTEDTITREQIAVMMYRYAKYRGYDVSGTEDLNDFEDGLNVNDYAKEALEWAVGNGIINGKAGNLLDPQGNASRAECAKIMMNFVEKYEQ